MPTAGKKAGSRGLPGAAPVLRRRSTKPRKALRRARCSAEPLVGCRPASIPFTHVIPKAPPHIAPIAARGETAENVYRAPPKRAGGDMGDDCAWALCGTAD